MAGLLTVEKPLSPNQKAGKKMNNAYICDAVRTPIGRYGAGGLQSVDAAAPNDRFIALESGVLYDTLGKLPFGAVGQFRDRFPDDGPQDIRPDFDIMADLRASRVSDSVPLFKISGARQGTYLRQSVLDEYRNGVWSHNPIGEYDPTTGSATTLRVPANTGRDSGDTVKIRVLPITQLPPGSIVTAPLGPRQMRGVIISCPGSATSVVCSLFQPVVIARGR